ncbi:MAG: Excinuclease ABC subunit C, partial [uncultured Solirubrobacteraceae bacterium]
RGVPRRAPGRPRPRHAAPADRVLRHLEPHGHPHRRLDGGLRGRRPEEVGLPALHHPRAHGGRAGRLRRHGGGPLAADEAVGGPAGPLPARPQPQRVVRHAAERRRHRRRPGAARRGPAGARGLRRAGRGGHLPGQADRGGLRPGPPRPDPARPRHAGAPAPAARARRGPPLRHHPPPPAARQVHAQLRAGRAARGGAPAQAHAAPALRLARGGPLRLARRARGRAGPAGQDGPGPVRLPAPHVVRL